MIKPPKTTGMQVFEYEVFDRKHVRISGEITARTITIAKTILKTQGYNIIKIRKKPFDLFGIFKKSEASSEQVTLFTRQLSTLMTAGIPLVQALGIVADTMPNTNIYHLIQKLRLEIESGASFSAALKKYPKTFDDLYCSLVETGEHSGTLDAMLNRLAAYKEKVEALKRKVKKALYYPIAVLVIAGIVTAVLLIKVVPTFKDMFANFGVELPAFTQMVLGLSEILQNYGLYVLVAVIILGYMYGHLYRHNQAFKNMIQRLSLKIPVLGPILDKTAVARFARTLSTTTAAGIPITDALPTVARATGNVVYRNATMDVLEGLTGGRQMRAAMKKTGVFPAMVVQMIGIGEESGALEEMLSKLSNIYEDEVNQQVDGLTSLLEPLIMVILGVVVGGLVIAMYLPIFKMGALF